MKILLSHIQPEDSGSHTWIQDINNIDMFVENSEATEIIVDNFLTAYNYSSIGSLVAKIASKLRLNGKIIVYQQDIDFVCHQYNKTGIDIQDLNTLLFNGGIPMYSVLNAEVVSALLTSTGLTIEQKQINTQNMQSIIVARRDHV